jgi:hypothetical protein
MRLFYDTRLDYFVTAPGSESPATGAIGKAGDTASIEVQFGRSSDPVGNTTITEATTWTPVNLAASTNITIGIKESGQYGDGPVLASTSSFTNDAGLFTYYFTLSLNTTEINTALLRDDADADNDVSTLDCNFELTRQDGGAGGWKSSILPLDFTLYNDVLVGTEATPTDAGDPDEYVLKLNAITWVKDATSLTGGTASDFDSVVTVGLTAGQAYALSDQDTDPQTLRIYKLYAGTDAESAPDIIRPDDYDGSTNAVVWKLQKIATSGIASLLDDATPQLGGDLDANGFNIAFDTATGITDDSGNELLMFTKTATAVNYADIANAATAGAVSISAKGSDAAIDLDFIPKGAGNVTVNGVRVLTTADSLSGIDVQIFTSSGTWTKPAGKYHTRAILIGGGAGGQAGGCANVAGTIAGGYGGAAGGYVICEYQTSALGATESVAVGSGGTGGIASLGSESGGTTGEPGSSGGDTSFSSIKARGGAAGIGATGAGLTNNVGVAPVIAATSGLGGARGAAGVNNGAAPAAITAALCPTGGGGGGGGDFSGGTLATGGAGGSITGAWLSTSLVGGAGGSISNGTAGTTTDYYIGLGGGGGATTYAGAAGANYGGGGGGGGAFEEGTVGAGAGGNGAGGIAIIITV